VTAASPGNDARSVRPGFAADDRAGGNGLLHRVARLTPAERHAATLFFLGLLPAALTLGIVAGAVGHAFAIEFRGNLWLPGRDILAGRSPYDISMLDRVAAHVRQGGTVTGFQTGVFPAYPAPTLLMGVPLALLPFTVARWVWLGFCLCCPALALRLIGVRDWRAYGATYISIVVISAEMLGSLTLPLLVGLAALWRYRDDWRRAGPIAAVVILAKLFLWPLLIWLLVSRRHRAALVAAVVAAICCVIGWAAIDFAGVTSYPHLLGTLSDIERSRGYSFVRAGLALHLGSTGANLFAYAIGAVVLTCAALASLRPGRARDEQAFTFAVIAALVLSPIVWEQYYALLFVPIALINRRFGAIWLAPLLLWLAPYNSTEGHPERLVSTVVVLAIVAFATTRRARSRLGVSRSAALTDSL
jgi:hypothetical protein